MGGIDDRERRASAEEGASMPRQRQQPPPPRADTAIERTLNVIGARWGAAIVAELLGGERRFGEIRAAMPGASAKMVILRLRDLERRGLVTRTQHPVIPPRVEYHLTADGCTLRPVIEAMGAWATDHGGKIGLTEAERVTCDEE